jgi:hypothetical protein
VNAPAATLCALVIVASGRLRDVRLSQDVAAIAGTLASANANRAFKARIGGSFRMSIYRFTRAGFRLSRTIIEQ